MIKYEDYSRAELKKIAAAKGAVEYHNMNKAQLVKLITNMESKREENKEVSAKDTAYRGTNLSHKALQWKNYLTRVNITPEIFLQRFPTHAEKQYIEELIVKPSENETEESAD